MRHKTAIVILISGLFVGTLTYAKPKPQPQHQATIEEIVAKMKKQLELTDQQAADVKPIIENYLAQEQQLKLDEKKQLSHVLTGEQLYTWNFLQNEAPRDKKKK